MKWLIFLYLAQYVHFSAAHELPHAVHDELGLQPRWPIPRHYNLVQPRAGKFGQNKPPYEGDPLTEKDEEDDGEPEEDDTAGEDYDSTFQQCQEIGTNRRNELYQAIDNDQPDINPEVIPMSTTAPYYRIVVIDEPENSVNIELHIKWNYAFGIVVEDPFKREDSEYQYSQWISVAGNDYRTWSVREAGHLGTDMNEHPYGGYFSQKDGTWIISRYFKNFDETPKEHMRYPSDIIYSAITWLVGRTYTSSDAQPIEPSGIKYIVIEDIQNDNTIAVLRRVFKDLNFNLNDYKQVNNPLYVTTREEAQFNAILGTQNVSGLVRMLAHHHRAFENRVPTEFVLGFRPFRFTDLVPVRYLDSNDNMLTGSYYLGIYLGERET